MTDRHSVSDFFYRARLDKTVLYHPVFCVLLSRATRTENNRSQSSYLCFPELPKQQARIPIKGGK